MSKEPEFDFAEFLTEFNYGELNQELGAEQLAVALDVLKAADARAEAPRRLTGSSPPRGRAMKEADFSREIRKSLELAGAWAYKIPDAPILPKSSGFRRAPFPRPFDIAACWEGRLVAIEVKRLLGYQAFGMRHLRDSQDEHLTEVAASGARAFVFLVVWQPRTMKRLLIFPWETFPRSDTIKKRELEAWPYVEMGDWNAQEWIRNIGPCSFDAMSTAAGPAWVCSRHLQTTLSEERPQRCSGVDL